MVNPLGDGAAVEEQDEVCDLEDSREVVEPVELLREDEGANVLKEEREVEDVQNEQDLQGLVQA